MDVMRCGPNVADRTGGERRVVGAPRRVDGEGPPHPASHRIALDSRRSQDLPDRWRVADRGAFDRGWAPNRSA